MSPLDIPQLDWNDFRVNPAVDAACRDLGARADRPILLHNRALVPRIENGFRTAWSGGIHIFVDPESPTCSHTLVHELLHEILIAEGYSQIANIRRDLDLLREILANDMQHPEIFRRMEEVYKIDMEPYWGHWHNEMRRSVGIVKERTKIKDCWLTYFPRVYTWFFQKVSEPYLAEYAPWCPTLYRAVETAAKETEQIGFTTAEKHLRSIELFREHWMKFCKRNLPHSSYGPPPHTPILESTVSPIIERDMTVTADNIIALLSNSGFDAR